MEHPQLTSLVAVLGVSKKDIDLAELWLEWTSFLAEQPGGNVSKCTLVITLTRNITDFDKQRLRIAAGWGRGMFRLHFVTLPDENERGYPISASHLFLRSLEHCERHFSGAPILWIEADAVPVKPNWFTLIAEEYGRCHMPFLGHLELNCQPPHLAGVAVYPPDWRARSPRLASILTAGDIRTWGPGKGQAFDMYAGPELIPQAQQSHTIQQIWKAPPIGLHNLSLVHPDTCLFHQSKDGTLIRTLANVRFPEFLTAA